MTSEPVSIHCSIDVTLATSSTMTVVSSLSTGRLSNKLFRELVSLQMNLT